VRPDPNNELGGFMTVDPTPMAIDRITAEQAREASDSAREGLTQRAIQDIYKKITYAAKEGNNCLKYDSTTEGFSRVSKDALTRELTSSGYSVKFDEYIDSFHIPCHFILLAWD
jgi:hypothetical protein